MTLLRKRLLMALVLTVAAAVASDRLPQLTSSDGVLVFRGPEVGGGLCPKGFTPSSASLRLDKVPPGQLRLADRLWTPSSRPPVSQGECVALAALPSGTENAGSAGHFTPQ